MPHSDYISHSQLLLQYLFAIESLTEDDLAADRARDAAEAAGKAGEATCLA